MGNWAEWSAGVANLVGDLYEDDSLDVAGQRAQLAKLRIKLTTMERALADQRYRSIFDDLANLHGKLSRRVDMADAVLDSLELNPDEVKAARLESARSAVSQALQDLERDLNAIPNGRPWLKYVRATKLNELMKQGASSDPVLLHVQKKFKSEKRPN